MKLNPAIFKAYDIRGIYPTDLDEDIAENIGRAFVAVVQAEKVVVGRDMRLSGPALIEAVVRGITRQGADVVDIGMVSTDQYYYACATLDLPGMMVTASHNPKEYNGFKMVRKMPYLLSGDSGIRDLHRLVQGGGYPDAHRQGNATRLDLRMEFIDRLTSIIDMDAIRPLKVVVDTGNGMVGPIWMDVCRRMPITLIGMYLEPDGSLPNHGLDPLQPENRAELQRRVAAEGADIGFAFDGDGDRFFAIDDRGEFVSGDFLTAILGEYLLEKRPGEKIIYDVRASLAVPELIRAAGGQPIMERVGHAFIKRRMADEDALFAGEVTGHYYFKDFFYADSGMLPALFLLELLSKRRVRMSDLLLPLERKYFISGEINSRVADPDGKMKALAQRYADAQILMLDGLSVDYPTWRFNLRSSNTEPLLRLNLEAKTREEMEMRRDELLSLIRHEG